MFKKAAVRGSKKDKQSRRKSTTNTDTFVYKPRKEREYKPKNPLPDPFYKSQRHGYAWCDDCNGMEVNALVGLVLTCRKGHSRTLLTHEEGQAQKGIKQPKQEVDIVKFGKKKTQQITLLMI